MIDHEVNRLSRLVALLTLLQTKRMVTAAELAKRFSVSTRTIYRDIRTLESAGIPVITHDGKGYAMLEGYRLPPVMFSRGEATALLTAEKLAARFTDPATALLTTTAMDKLRAALRYTDRDHLETLSPQIQVLEPASESNRADTYQQLLRAVTSRLVADITYNAAETGLSTSREIEPIGLYLSQHRHVVAFCRLRQQFRDFRLDRIRDLNVKEEVFAVRPQALQNYWIDQAKRQEKEKVVIRFRMAGIIPALARRMEDTKHQFGFTHETLLSDGSVEMLFLVGSLPYLATWLLPYAGAVTVLEPVALQDQLRELARQVHHAFCA
ncbi:YafY family transcriptional regulator [Dyadobacter chenwenxiniae]|uniref:YafY family transcriptional regulator n=1 Tax=Dyadobacter chenwenxiniae TaxID=2906456 RepID=A0A9X1PGD4_9BACT|nr:YafY family protein [Dyadobacter chenwenxiniae]MCF0060233.1 YafY family transcriptional regulator [Dyadobacter chenwenxiniae]UON85971.1 YafY family transcriptional regulator [Dyadobacter chenwenxiniae]